MKSSLKKFLVFGSAFVVVVLVVGLLFSNKAKNEATVKKSVNMSEVPVSVAEVKKQKLEDNLSIVGILFGNSEVNLLSEAQGKILSINANVGDHVSTGTLLAKVDDELKKAALENAEANYNKTKNDLERYKKLNLEKSVNDSQVEGAELAFKVAESQYTIAKRQLADTKIVSPISGVITTRNVEVGTVVATNTPIFTIIDISTLKLKVNVPENEVFKIHTGEEVQMKTEVYGGVTFTGKISNINDKADEAHTYLVEIKIPNSKDHPLKAGMFARVIFNSVTKDESIVIPREALLGSIQNPQVYVVENNVAKVRNIVVGNDAGNLLEITQGLSVGDIVVTNGQINLKDNTPVTIIK